MPIIDGRLYYSPCCEASYDHWRDESEGEYLRIYHQCHKCRRLFDSPVFRVELPGSDKEVYERMLSDD